jgi:hypothetical protein
MKSVFVNTVILTIAFAVAMIARNNFDGAVSEGIWFSYNSDCHLLVNLFANFMVGLGCLTSGVLTIALLNGVIEYCAPRPVVIGWRKLVS